MNRGNRRGDFSPMRDPNDFQPGNRGPRNFNDRPEFNNEAVEEKLIVLDPDVAEAFRTSEQVNRTLRQLLMMARQIGGGRAGTPRQGVRGNRRRRRNGPNTPNYPSDSGTPNRGRRAPHMEGLPVDEEFEEE